MKIKITVGIIATIILFILNIYQIIQEGFNLWAYIFGVAVIIALELTLSAYYLERKEELKEEEQKEEIRRYIKSSEDKEKKQKERVQKYKMLRKELPKKIRICFSSLNCNSNGKYKTLNFKFHLRNKSQLNLYFKKVGYSAYVILIDSDYKIWEGVLTDNDQIKRYKTKNAITLSTKNISHAFSLTNLLMQSNRLCFGQDIGNHIFLELHFEFKTKFGLIIKWKYFDKFLMDDETQECIQNFLK